MAWHDMKCSDTSPAPRHAAAPRLGLSPFDVETRRGVPLASAASPVKGVLRVLDAAAAALTGEEPEGFWSTVPEDCAAGDLELAPWTIVFLDVSLGR